MEEYFDEIMNRYKLYSDGGGERKRPSVHGHNHATYLYPYNLSIFQISPTMDNLAINTGPDTEKHESRWHSFFSVIFVFVLYFVCL